MRDEATVLTYDQYAEVYDAEVVEFWDRFPKTFLNRFRELLPGTQVLDVGSGRDALLLKSLGLEITCVDASKSMVEITKKLGFDTHLADFSEISFADCAFHGIWAYTSLIHVPKHDAEQTIARLREFIVPGGAFAIGVIEGTNAGMVERKTMPGALRYFKNYTADELTEMITPLGFKLMHEERYQPHSSVYLDQIYRSA